ncbi:hypothetical protein D9619_006659 [Psilocybe cf. subviscida]|uniref:C2H2-type domain-containing protein n=1 Tax=Psilocybe cf. subviscida TaxID=2480587 RepID=A0A8H5B4P0_9AGAR|nr:hypothetical protein D9619_006659 [Psilocybe cf. subviscida]
MFPCLKACPDGFSAISSRGLKQHQSKCQAFLKQSEAAYERRKSTAISSKVKRTKLKERKARLNSTALEENATPGASTSALENDAPYNLEDQPMDHDFNAFELSPPLFPQPISTPPRPSPPSPPPQLTQAGRPKRKERRPARYLDVNPEPLAPVEEDEQPSALLPRLRLIDLHRSGETNGASPPSMQVPPPAPVHRNESVEMLMNWKDTGAITKSDAEVNRLVKDVLLDPSFKLEDLHGFNVARENRESDAADNQSPFLDSFQTANIDIEIPSGTKGIPPATFSVPGLLYRKLTAVIEAAFSSPLAPHFHLSPFKLFHVSPSGKEERVFSELYNSDVLIEEHDKVQRAPLPPDDPDCKREKIVFGLMIWSDSTHLANFGTAKLWPIYSLFAGISKYIRSQPNSGACQHIAYIPSLPDSFQDFASSFFSKWSTQKKDLLTHCRRELMHGVWKFLLNDDFVHAHKYGMVVKCADGIERRVYPRILTYSADYPEKVLLATIRDKGLCPCPRCLVQKSKLDQTGTAYDRNTRLKNGRKYLLDCVQIARNAVYKLAAAISGTVVNRLLKPTSSVPTVNAFIDRLGVDFDISRMLVVDLLHEFELGVWKALFTHLIRVLYAAASDGSLVTELDRRFRDMPTFGTSTIRRFATNASEMKKLAARDFEDLLQCSIPAFDGLLDEPYNSMAIMLLYRTAEWHAFAKFRLHTESTLQHLEELTTEFGRLMRKFRDVASSAFVTLELPKETGARQRRQQSGKGKKVAANNTTARKPKGLNLFTYKWHALGDYVKAVRLFGGTDGFSTQVGELAHKIVKRLYGMTNKRNAERQIARRYRRLERASLAYDRKRLHGHKQPKATKQGDADGGGDPDLRYHISASKYDHQDIFGTIRSNKGDPAYHKFLPKLQDHLLGRIVGREFDGDMHEEFADSDRNSIRFIGNKIYSVRTCNVYYTSYDLQRQCDTINPHSHPDIMLRSPVAGGDDPYWYARVIGVYHANIWVENSAIPEGRNARRMDFLWVRWFGEVPGYRSGIRRARLPKVGFVESTDDYAFSFIDPANVIRGCHLIPAFNDGRSSALLPHPRSAARRLNPQDDDDWSNFYVNIFVDRDMMMRYFGGGIGHLNNTPPQQARGSDLFDLNSNETAMEDEDNDSCDGASGGENAAMSEGEVEVGENDEEGASEDGDDGDSNGDYDYDGIDEDEASACSSDDDEEDDHGYATS